MDLLKAELERKRQRTSELVAKAGGEKGGRRFVRRGEAARLEQQEREREQAKLVRWVLTIHGGGWSTALYLRYNNTGTCVHCWYIDITERSVPDNRCPDSAIEVHLFYLHPILLKTNLSFTYRFVAFSTRER